MARQQLPPQIKKIELGRKVRGRPVVRYQLTVDIGTDPTTGRRKQYRKRFDTEDEARTELSKIQGEVAKGTHVHPSKVTVDRVVNDWLASKHSLKPSTLRGHRVVLQPVVEQLGDTEVQKLTRRDVDDLILALRAGGLPSPGGKPRKPWSARTVNYMLSVFSAALDDQVKQGTLVRNVVRLVDRIPGEQSEMQTFTEDEVEKLLEVSSGDQYWHAWMLALCGLRRGEICGLRWSDVDLDSGLLTVRTSRVAAGSEIHEGSPKSRRSARTLPMPEDLTAALRAARLRQAEDRLAAGGAWNDTGYVVVDRAGDPPTPNAITYWWRQTTKRAGVRPIRLHDARHTCATLMHMRGVPIAVIAAWLGHASAAFTLSVYAHAQDPALAAAASSAPVVTIRDKNGVAGS